MAAGTWVAVGAAPDQVKPRQPAAARRPDLDTSLALEMLGFGGPDVREGGASLREKRAHHRFDGACPF